MISNVIGVSGRAILEAIMAGGGGGVGGRETARLHCSREALIDALRGRVTAHHGFLLRQHLQLIDECPASIAAFEAEIGAALEPFRQAAEHLRTIPGVSTIAAHVIVAEVGIDMTRFPTVRHLISWAGLCPRLDEDPGEGSRRVRKGAPWLKTVLVQCAWAATRTKGTYLQAQYHRLKSRRGARRRSWPSPPPSSPPRTTSSGTGLVPGPGWRFLHAPRQGHGGPTPRPPSQGSRL